MEFQNCDVRRGKKLIFEKWAARTPIFIIVNINHRITYDDHHEGKTLGGKVRVTKGERERIIPVGRL